MGPIKKLMNHSGLPAHVWLLGLLLTGSLRTHAQPVIQAACGAYHSAFLKSDGSLWTFGNNVDGELGNGTTTSTNRPTQIIGNGVTFISGGSEHTLFVKSDGTQWGMGRNYSGELGNSSHNSQTGSLVPAEGMTHITGVAAGFRFSLFLKNDGSLWAVGANGSGQCGNATTTSFFVPQSIIASNVSTIAAGYAFALVLKTDGSLWAMGDNSAGQLGDGTTINSTRPKRIQTNGVTAISAGAAHSLFIKSDGSLWSMGYNAFGQLGDGSTNNTSYPKLIVPSNVTAVAAGMYHSLFQMSDGSLWAMGDNNAGQLGDGTRVNFTNRAERIVPSGVTAIASGNQATHSLFIKEDGSVWAMGLNSFGELGLGNTSNTNRPAKIPAMPNYKLTSQFGASGDVRLTFLGTPGTNYVLERATCLSPADWSPQTTNTAFSYWPLFFTNTPNPATNNFWRIRSEP